MISPYLDIETEERDGFCLVHLSGEVDLSNATLLEGAVDGPVHASRNLILNCQRLTYIDSTGFKVLLNLRTQGCRVVLVALAPAIQKVLKIMSLDALIPVVPSVEEALKTLREEDSLRLPSGQ